MMSGYNLFCSFLLLVAWVAPFATAYDSVWPMNYTDVNDPDVALMGYMTLPPALAAEDDSTDDSSTIGELPAVVILPVRRTAIVKLYVFFLSDLKEFSQNLDAMCVFCFTLSCLLI